jgi:hypothetical protein
MYRWEAVLFALFLLPEAAVGQVAWLGSEELHAAVGGAIGSALGGILPLLITVAVLIPCGVIYGVTRLIERRFKSRGCSPRPVTSTVMALLLFAVSFWTLMAATGETSAGMFVVGLVVGLIPAMLVVVIELVRIRRSERTDSGG